MTRPVEMFITGTCVGVLVCAIFFACTFEPSIEKLEHQMTHCPKGCRTEADLICEKFRNVLRLEHACPSISFGADGIEVIP